ncbi:hypothetical protein NPIL_12241 [Nephila pilipes]|uniref:Uncharacterized protein n=1 Tax=Nephila pilipes TaxID=299642 RepID=A0A8X6PEU8_NEPPI|nr:hypothetical protein NPIL_12241 [Nephila pilipes]
MSVNAFKPVEIYRRNFPLSAPITDEKKEKLREKKMYESQGNDLSTWAHLKEDPRGELVLYDRYLFGKDVIYFT